MTNQEKKHEALNQLSNLYDEVNVTLDHARSVFKGTTSREKLRSLEKVFYDRLYDLRFNTRFPADYFDPIQNYLDELNRQIDARDEFFETTFAVKQLLEEFKLLRTSNI